MRTDSQSERVVHGSCVAFGPAAVLISGAAGSGKSALSLQLMALGAELIADDRTQLTVIGGTAIRASCPEAIRGRIEARGIGILAAESRSSAIVNLSVDLDTTETERLPPHRTVCILGIRIPLLHRCACDHFPASIIQYLKGGRAD